MEGRFHLPERASFSLADIAAAHTFAEAGARRGKVVVSVP
jgi:NADPH:quinone reductase-like Zn-dependent oxidoreductase